MDNRKIKIVGNTRPSGHWGGAVYSTDGLCPTITSGSTVKNGLKIMVNEKETIEKHFTKIDEHRAITTDRERESVYAITTRPRSTPIHKKQDNYILEECIGSTQKHAARTDGTYSPTLTCAMGKGGGQIPMLKLRESTKKGYKEAHPGDGVLFNRRKRKVAKGIVRKEESGCLQTQGVWGAVTNDYRIRKLTPRECERLQAFPDDWTKYGKDGEEISDTQRYKCMGNAVTTSVVTFVINRMFEDFNE